MKKRLLAFTIVLVMLLSMIPTYITTGAYEGDYQNPEALQPTSPRVVFISDNIEGSDGSGFDAENPFIPLDHESFDPTAAYPKNHLQTAFYQATELLMSTGGTIVICGPVFFGINESYGSGSTQRDVCTASFGNNVIKFTSVYDGVDYRKTNGAKITIKSPASLTVMCSSIWENIDIETDGTERIISFDERPTLIGEGVNCCPSNSDYTGISGHYVSLAAGHRYAGTNGHKTSLTVKSGTYNKIVGGIWGASASHSMSNAETNLVLDGTTTVLGMICGTVNAVSNFSGNVNIIINDGVYECDIFGVGNTGMLNSNGKVNIKINGGDFENLWSLSDASFGHSNYAPMTTVLDLSDFKGSNESYRAILDYNIGITNIIYKKEEIPDFVEPKTTDPRTLEESSQRVLFISDDITNSDGTGLDADNPLIPMDHENFDPSVTYPKYYLQTAFYQATEMLKETGGTIVVCGPVRFGLYESYGSGVTNRDVMTAYFGSNTIKITSEYNGVDYRETNGAKMTVETPAMMVINGQTIWENIDIETVGTYRAISFCGYSTRVGKGVKCYPSDPAFTGVSINYVSLSGGHRYTGGVDKYTNLLVQSGTYNIIAGGLWGVNNTRRYDSYGNLVETNNLDGDSFTKLTLEGTTTVYGTVIGTNYIGAEFSGQSLIVINDGYYECDIACVGSKGMLNDNGVVKLVINGGKFKSAWSVSNGMVSGANYKPAKAVLDMSGWCGSRMELAYLCDVVVEFHEINLPEGITAEDITDILNKGITAGDTDGDGLVNSDDAVYLLYNAMFGGKEYMLAYDCDFDKNGFITTDDAIYLLYHLTYGGYLYPIS